jgi:hypothetical protein
MMTQTFTARNGKTYPLHDDVDLPAPKADEAALIAKWRSNAELDKDERRLLAQINTRDNLHSAADWLGDEELSEFGFETLDQVHGQSWHPDVCEGQASREGCVVHQVFDHRLRDTPDQIKVHAHRIHQTCSRHATLTFKDHHEHQAHLESECFHKERVLAAITDRYGLSNQERPAWRFNENHELEIDTNGHPSLKPQHVIQVIHQDFPQHVIHVK